MTVSNVLVDAIDLLFNFRGLGWAWSSEPFYVDPNPPRSISHQFFKLFVKIASLDAAHYVVQLVRPTAYRPEGDTIYDYTLDPLPHFLQVLTISVCGMVLIYSSVDIMYQLLALIGQLVFGQSLAQWPRIANRPWLAESVTEFLGKRWHQFSVTFSSCKVRDRERTQKGQRYSCRERINSVQHENIFTSLV